MVWMGKPTPAKLVMMALLCFAISAGATYSWWTFKGIPPRAGLQQASGRVVWMESTRNAVRFRLEGTPQALGYLSKSNAMGQVRDALGHAGKTTVTVLFDAADVSGPLFSDERYSTVYELHVGARSVRTHQQVAQAWASDEAWAGWLGLVFAVFGLYGLFGARRLARRRRISGFVRLPDQYTSRR